MSGRGPLFLVSVNTVPGTFKVLINMSYKSEQISESCIYPSSSCNSRILSTLGSSRTSRDIVLHSGDPPSPRNFTLCLQNTPVSKETAFQFQVVVPQSETQPQRMETNHQNMMSGRPNSSQPVKSISKQIQRALHLLQILPKE